MATNSEDYLIDDDISFAPFGEGKLAFVSETGGPEDTSVSAGSGTTATTGEVPTERISRPGPLSIRFEIIDARVESDNHGKFVVYTILVIQSTGLDKSPVKIDRRYSDFRNLNSSLRQQYSSVLQNVKFPPKLLSGNYKAETIAHRSRMFEQYLSHVFAIDVIRVSSELGEFFYGRDLQEGYRRIENGDYSGSLVHLRTAWQLQSKLRGDADTMSIATLSAIVSAYAAMENDAMACVHAEHALDCIGSTIDRHLVSLLRLAIRLSWKLGRDKHRLEARLQELRKLGVRVDDSVSLLELVVNRIQR